MLEEKCTSMESRLKSVVSEADFAALSGAKQRILNQHAKLVVSLMRWHQLKLAHIHSFSSANLRLLFTSTSFLKLLSWHGGSFTKLAELGEEKLSVLFTSRCAVERLLESYRLPLESILSLPLGRLLRVVAGDKHASKLSEFNVTSKSFETLPADKTLLFLECIKGVLLLLNANTSLGEIASYSVEDLRNFLWASESIEMLLAHHIPLPVIASLKESTHMCFELEAEAASKLLKHRIPVQTLDRLTQEELLTALADPQVIQHPLLIEALGYISSHSKSGGGGQPKSSSPLVEQGLLQHRAPRSPPPLPVSSQRSAPLRSAPAQKNERNVP